MEMTDVAAVVAAQVRARREANGWTQDDMAVQLRVVGLMWGQSALSRFERGDREPTVSELLLLAAALDVTPGELLMAPKEKTHVLLRSSQVPSGALYPAKALPRLLAGQGLDRPAGQWNVPPGADPHQGRVVRVLTRRLKKSDKSVDTEGR